MKLLPLITLLTISSIAHADSFFFDHARGWHWYEVIEVEKEKDKNTKTEQPTVSSPVTELKAWQQQLEAYKAKAILEPTETNVREYLIAQNQVARSASLFSTQWQKILWKYPELDYSLIKPTSFLAKQAYLDEHQLELEKAAKNFAKTHGLWFFFRSDCPYCHKFAPILKRIADKYGFHLMVISLDGGSLPDFPNAITNQGQAEKLNVKGVPAVFSVNPQTKDIAPLTYGLVSEGEFLERIWAQVQPNQGAL